MRVTLSQEKILDSMAINALYRYKNAKAIRICFDLA